MTYPPVEGQNVISAELSLSAPDGTMNAFVARPAAAGPHPGVVVLMEAFGLVGSIKDVARHLAGVGYVAIVPDLESTTSAPLTGQSTG